jgi:K+-transporting ATPase KdpF subunit
MSIPHIVGAVIAAVLFVYLIAALLYPEDFS